MSNLEVNPTILPDGECVYIIGDMILDKEQMSLIYGETERTGEPDESKRWTNGVLVYEFDESTIAPGSQEEAHIKNQIVRFNSEMSGCVEIK